MKKYTIEVNAEQLRGIAEACEFTSRFLSGQIETAYWPASQVYYTIDPSVRRTIDAYLAEVKRLAYNLDMYSSHGYGHDKHSDMLFEAYQTFRHALWLDSDDQHKHLTRHTVSSSPPILCESGVAFPKVTSHE